MQCDKLQVSEILNLIAFSVLYSVLSACVLGGLLVVLCEEGGGAHSVAQKLHKELVTGLVMSRYNPATIQFQVWLQ